jgi:hypothetical protein
MIRSTRTALPRAEISSTPVEAIVGLASSMAMLVTVLIRQLTTGWPLRVTVVSH